MFVYCIGMGLTRIELVTSRLSGVRSNQLSYRPEKISEKGRKGVRSAREMSNGQSSVPCVNYKKHPFLNRKEVIQPHLPVRLPCYDFTPLIGHTFGAVLRYRLDERLRVPPTRVV